jgi:hypothetical protein
MILHVPRACLLSCTLCHSFPSLLLLGQLLHVHLDTALHARLLDIGQRDETLSVRCMARWISNVLLQSDLLVCMDMLFVVLDTADPSQLVLFLLSKLELVQGLTQNAVL